MAATGHTSKDLTWQLHNSNQNSCLHTRNQVMNVMMTAAHTTYAALQLAALSYCRLSKLASLNEPAALFLRVLPDCKADP